MLRLHQRVSYSLNTIFGYPWSVTLLYRKRSVTDRGFCRCLSIYLYYRIFSMNYYLNSLIYWQISEYFQYSITRYMIFEIYSNLCVDNLNVYHLIHIILKFVIIFIRHGCFRWGVSSTLTSRCCELRCWKFFKKWNINNCND